MALGPGQTKILPMQSAAVATGNGTVVKTTDEIGGYTVLVCQIVGITTATVTFEAYCDAVPTWAAIQFTNLATGTAATTATADGIYRATVLGLMQVRARISAWTSGTITITGVLVA